MVEPLAVPVDFDAFWQEALLEVEALPLTAGSEPWRPGGEAEAAGVRCLRVSLQGVGGVGIGGLLQLPAGPSGACRAPLPALLHLAGYGGELLLHQDLVAAGFAVFDLSHRGMRWGSEGFDRQRPRPLLARDVEDRSRYVYRAIYQDCLLALRYLRSLPEVDGARLGVLGTSQGGGLTIGTAALGGVRAAAADLPWLTHFARQLAEPVDGSYNELKELLRQRPDLATPATATLAYFDTTSFATRLAAPTLVSLGQADTVCPPDSIRALFGRIPSCKALLEVPGLGHSRSMLWRRMAGEWMRQWV